jgi:ribosomal protein L31
MGLLRDNKKKVRIEIRERMRITVKIVSTVHPFFLAASMTLSGSAGSTSKVNQL